MINSSSFPTLSTSRFILRRLLESDAEDIFKLRSCVENLQYVERPLAETITDAENFIRKINSGIDNNQSLYWVITPKDNNNLLGTIGLWNISPDKTKAEIGFELLPENKGQRIMQEVIPEVIAYSFNAMALKIIQAVVHKENIKSIKLLEKSKFENKGLLSDFEPDTEEVDMLLYELGE